MTIANNPKTWLILLFLAFIFCIMLFIVRNYRSDAYHREKISDRLEIVDMV